MPDLKNNAQIDLVLSNLKAANKEQLFKQLSEKATNICGLPATTLYERMMDKEDNAGSGVGNGVAIPQMKFRHLKKPCTILALLQHPVDFKSFDEQPVTLVCIILSPESEGPLHLQRLSRISRLLRHKTLRTRLHETNDLQEINAAMGASNSWKEAA